MRLERQAPFFRKGMYDSIPRILNKHLPGRGRHDVARIWASWTVSDYFRGAYGGDKLSDTISVMAKPPLRRQPVRDRAAAARLVKDAARSFGAAAAGITELNRQWLYSSDLFGRRVRIAACYRYAIVILIKMDPAAIRGSPGYQAAVETGLAYSRMAFTASSMAEFIRYLGYRAVSCGNDTTLSIPLAIDAGLGELGRNGLLITPEFGPFVRICKVLTDLPLMTDRSAGFGVGEFCRTCRRCANACGPDAIDRHTEPSFKIVSPSNNKGIRRWPVNHDRCYGFWIENGAECSNCIAACPFGRVLKERV